LAGDNGKYTLQRNVDEVVLNATVLDDKQHLVTTLAKDDFKVFEDGVPRPSPRFSTRTSPYRWGFWSTTPAPCAPSARR
jgi:Ca-activated chloride channel family protein